MKAFLGYLGFFLSCCVIPTAIVVGAILIERKNDRKELEEAREQYKRTLRELKHAPGNANLRESAPAAGREYARLARERGRESLFDEVALMNDMNAVAGGSVDALQALRAPTTSTVETRLQQLVSLRDNGLITKEEYNDRRSQILSEL